MPMLRKSNSFVLRAGAAVCALAAALATALRQIVEDHGLRERLAAAAARSVEPLAEEGLLTVVETTLPEVAR